MNHEMINLILTKALVDKEFCQLLLKETEEAIKEFDLTPEEITVLTRIKASTLEEFSEKIYRWMLEREKRL